MAVLRELVEGVVEHRDRIDELIETHAHGWTLDRMPAVDRALLRLGAWEILFNDDVPDAVAVDEAVERPPCCPPTIRRVRQRAARSRLAREGRLSVDSTLAASTASEIATASGPRR